MAYKHGMKNTKLYKVWKTMKQRCKNPNDHKFKYYGAKGITVCEEWDKDFSSFYEWANNNGYEEHLSIERKNINLGYCPENCTWATRKEQANNKSNNRVIVFNGEKRNLCEWAEITGINSSTISARLKKGWSVEKSLTTKAVIGRNQFSKGE